MENNVRRRKELQLAIDAGQGILETSLSAEQEEILKEYIAKFPEEDDLKVRLLSMKKDREELEKDLKELRAKQESLRSEEEIPEREVKCSVCGEIYTELVLSETPSRICSEACLEQYEKDEPCQKQPEQ